MNSTERGKNEANAAIAELVKGVPERVDNVAKQAERLEAQLGAFEPTL